MNKKAQVNIFIVLMLGIICFVLGMALAPVLNTVVSEAMNSDQLNCTDTSISQMKHAVCTQTDMFTPLFSGLIFGIAGLLIAGVAIR